MSVIYKIVAKVMALRLVPFLQKHVTPHQHAFIKGRSIFDNILAALIGVEYAKLSKQQYVLLQLDLDKAYDRAHWLFIQATMLKMEFGRSTSTFMFMLCFQARSHLLFNGVVVGAFSVRRSVRQGCPLAPLLFAILTHPLVLPLEDAA